jgi:hypothetical protein
LARKLLRNLNVLNLLLLAAALGFAFNRLLPLIDSPVGYTVPRVKETAPKAPEEAPAPAPSTNPLDYTVIAEENLFHPERKIPPEKKAEAPLPKPEFVLYGTLVTSDLGVAYLEDKKAPPVTTAGRGKRQTALKKGEALSGFTLKEVQADRVTMIRGEETLVVSLNDPQNPKTREGVPEPAKPGAVPKPGAAAPSPSPAAPATSRKVSPPAAAPLPAPAAGTTAAVTLPATPPLSGAPTAGVTAARPGSGGGFIPSRPRYRPLPPAAGSSGGPYPAPSPTVPSTPNRPYP